MSTNQKNTILLEDKLPGVRVIPLSDEVRHFDGIGRRVVNWEVLGHLQKERGILESDPVRVVAEEPAHPPELLVSRIRMIVPVAIIVAVVLILFVVR